MKYINITKLPISGVTPCININLLIWLSHSSIWPFNMVQPRPWTLLHLRYTGCTLDTPHIHWVHPGCTLETPRIHPRYTPDTSLDTPSLIHPGGGQLTSDLPVDSRYQVSLWCMQGVSCWIHINFKSTCHHIKIKLEAYIFLGSKKLQVLFFSGKSIFFH